MDKQELRAYIADTKRNISPEARIELSAPILRRLAVHPRFTAASTVLLYHSLPDEVNTHDFIPYWGTQKRLLLPVVENDEIVLRQFKSGQKLHTGRFGIQEPDGEPFEDYASIDLAIVPGVAFDRKGNRLGRGKGYYDRLLSRMAHTDVYRLGICFPYQLVESVPTDAHDIAMDEIL